MRNPYKLQVAFEKRHGLVSLKTFEIAHDELAHETMLRVAEEHQKRAGTRLGWLIRRHIKCLNVAVYLANLQAIFFLDVEPADSDQKAFIQSCDKDKCLTAMIRRPSDFASCEPLIRMYPEIFKGGKDVSAIQTRILVVGDKMSVERVTVIVAVATVLIVGVSIALGVADHSLSNGLAVFAAVVSLVTIMQTGLLWSRTART